MNVYSKIDFPAVSGYDKELEAALAASVPYIYNWGETIEFALGNRLHHGAGGHGRYRPGRCGVLPVSEGLQPYGQPASEFCRRCDDSRGML